MTRKTVFLEWLRINFGLLIFALGLEETIFAGIGIAPWDMLAMGLSYRTHLSYGTIYACINLVILALDLVMREKIGFGTLFDAFLTGYYVDFWAFANPLSKMPNVFASIALLICGLFIMAVGQYFYMSASEGCGPRDAFLIGIGKRLSRLSIGTVQILIQASVFVLGWIAGGPVGIGTALSVVFMGVTMQIVFRILHFEPREIHHKGILQTCRILASDRGL